MSRKLVVTRTVTTEECCWLDRTFSPGDEIYEFNSATYGCINWNQGIAASLEPNEGPFFEFPLDAVCSNPVRGTDSNLPKESQ